MRFFSLSNQIERRRKNEIQKYNWMGCLKKRGEKRVSEERNGKKWNVAAAARAPLRHTDTDGTIDEPFDD